MNEQIQTRFTRLETALDSLIDSITTYNPSPAAASTLVSINDDLNDDLELCMPSVSILRQLIRS